jgi:outer membrane cobalamin receptor
MIVLAACGRHAPVVQDAVLLTPDGQRIITQRAIEQSGARTAWDALQRTVPFYVFREGGRGRPWRIDHRGRSTIARGGQPKVLVDGAELSDFSVLGGMPASDLFEIEVLTGIHGTTYYGTGATNGVIRIRTKIDPS